MNQKSDIEILFNKLEKLKWYERLFFWSKVTYLIGKCREEYSQTLNEVKVLTSSLDNKEKEYATKIKLLYKDIENIQNNNDNLYNSNIRINNNLIEIKTKYEELNNKYKDQSKELYNIQTKFDLEFEKYTSKIEQYDKLQEDLRKEKEKETELKYLEQENTWKEHELLVENIICSICEKNGIKYYSKESVPFKGKPDNTIKIAGEFIIFDAKSPKAKDKLDSFATYIKIQADLLKKYIKEENVKKTIYLVVPFNTIKNLRDKLKELVINTSNYKVFIITPDSLESIILSLKKIEEYEFAEKLSPEDRDKICDIIGKFAHSAKRRIEIDNMLNEHTIDLLTKCEYLPEDIKLQSQDAEKSEKLNPPMDKLKKRIDLAKLNKKIKNIENKKNLLE